MDEVSFWVSGDPAAKGSRTQKTLASGKVLSWEQNKGVKPWMKAVEAELGVWATVHGTLPPPYKVILDFRIDRPKRPTYEWPVKGDLDKFCRATLDAMEAAGVIDNDKHVVRLECGKTYTVSVPGCAITVVPLL